LTSEELELIDQSARNCFTIEADGPQKIQIFSDADHKLYSLMPTQGAPTLLVSGISMHRIKGVDPRGDAISKVKSLAPIAGKVLDTATGLGYTAIAAAKTADHVTTIEVSPTTLEIARLNPWSHRLFNNPKITQIIGDSCEEVALFETGQFTRIIHDPPSFSMAGELYSGEFYQELFRVMQRRGRLYHYIGDLDSPSGRNNAIARGVIRRLSEVGFSRVVRQSHAFGLVAYK
jgi:predicted methyltransferase